MVCSSPHPLLLIFSLGHFSIHTLVTLNDRPMPGLATESLTSERCQTMPDLPAIPLCCIWCQDEYKSFDEVDITNIPHSIHRTATSWEHRNQIKEVIRSMTSSKCIPPLCLKGNGVACSLVTLQRPVHSYSLLLIHKLPSPLQSCLFGLSYMSLPFKNATNLNAKNLWLQAQHKEEWLYLHLISKAEVKTLLSFWKTEIGSCCTDRRSSISAITV